MSIWQRILEWRIAIGLCAILALGLGYTLWPQPLLVDVAEVDRGLVEISITDDGIARLEDVYMISAPITGRITRIEIEPGDRVIAGETEIVRIRPRPPELLDARTRTQRENTLNAAIAAEAMAKADLERRQAAVDLAQKTLARSQELIREGYATKARLDEAEAALEEQAAGERMARATLRQRAYDTARAEAALQEGDAGRTENIITVRAPTGGKVLQVLRESEAIVTEGTPLVELGDSDRLEIVVDLLSRDAVRVSSGDAVRISRWGGDVLAGRVRTVEPFGFLKVSALGIEEQRVNVIIDLVDDNPAKARLGHGYQLDATVVIWSKPDAVRVPLGAVFRLNDAWHVYRMAQGKAALTAINVGKISDAYAQVVAGLKEGDQVVLDPSDAVTDGAPVKRRTI
ncbi:MAG: HlyD family efflux transporter periplasmic adaptor subunit [Pseudomonadota bacterium]